MAQHGYYISCDVFNKFKDGEGNFKASLAIDVSGLLSLYEAAHLRIRGEEILDEAIAFTTTHLESIVSSINPHLLEKVTFALNRPIRKNLPRWWKNLDFPRKLPYARDRVVELTFGY
nr:(-)-germacrene D synthase-like [Ziziphus jujuba var. spinosa]